MSDTITQGAVDTTKTVDQVQVDNKTNDIKNEDFIKSLVEEKVSSLKQMYEEKEAQYKKQIQGLDRSVSDFQKKVKEAERKELTEKERLELEKRELQEEKSKLYKEQALTKLGFTSEDDSLNLMDYLHGETKEDILSRAENLKKFIDTQIKVGIEKGVNERLAQGYKPGISGISGNTTDFSLLSKDELSAKANEIKKMPQSAEKDKLIADLMKAQQKKFTGGK